MNEHLRQIFEAIIPAIENADIAYWVYGGVAIAGINGAYLRENPDVDIFVMSNDYDETIELVTRFEKELNWKHCDAKPQRGRRKREWRMVGERKDIFSVIEVYPVGENVRFIFGTDFIPQNPLTAVRRRIGDYSFITPSSELIKELLVSKIDSGKLLKDRREKLKHDARVLMSDDEYRALCAHLDRIK